MDACTRGALIVVALSTACVRSSAVVCGDKVCPPDSTCHETGLCVPAGCGDGVVNGTEECDGENLAGEDCRTRGFYYGEGLACSPVCEIDETGCTGVCGDHVVNGEEHCDGAPLPREACIDYGFDIGRMSCTSACSPGFDTCRNVGWFVAGGDQIVPLNAIWGAADNEVFVVGEQGRIWVGDGSTWTIMSSGTTATLHGVWGTSASDVFVVGANGTILHYDGSTWSPMVSATSEALYAIWGRNGSDIYAVGEGETILHYDGSTWTVENDTGPPLRGVYGDANRVIAVGDRGITTARIFRKEAGTSTWIRDTPPDLGFDYELDAIWGIDGQFFAVGGEGLNGRSVILHHETGTWTATLPDTRAELVSVWGSSAGNVIAGGHGGAMLRFNGASWRRIHADSERTVTGLWGSGAFTVRASTLAGTILASDGFEWHTIDGVGSPLDDHRDVWRYPGGQLTVVGQSQILDVAATVTAPQIVYDGTPPVDNVMHSVWSTAGELGQTTTFVASSFGVLVRGPSETAFTEETNLFGFFQGVWGTSATNVYVVGAISGGATSAAIMKRFGGSSWSDATLPADTPRLLDVWGSGPGDVYAVGLGGTLLHSTDGQTFTRVSADVDSSVALRSVWGSGPDDVVVAGDSGTVLHFDGTSWRRPSLATSATFTTVIGTSRHDIFVAGTGSLWHYDGVSWTRMSLPVPFNVTGAALAFQSLAFAGTLGGVLTLNRTCVGSETSCSDAWDNDCDGSINCADSDCSGAPECASGGTCEVIAELTCNASIAGTTYTGIARIDDLPCLSRATAGPEVTYRFVAPAAGEVTFALADMQGTAELAVTEASALAGACDVHACTATTAGTATITAAGQTVYVIVDSPSDGGADFALTTSCN